MLKTTSVGGTENALYLRYPQGFNVDNSFSLAIYAYRKNNWQNAGEYIRVDFAAENIVILRPSDATFYQLPIKIFLCKQSIAVWRRESTT